MSVHTETYIRDNITYVISVESVPKGYVGHWYCDEDQETGSSSKVDESIEAAISGAIAALSGHHFMKHQK